MNPEKPDVFEGLIERASKSLERLYVLQESVKELRESGIKNNPEQLKFVESILKSLSYFKEYYFLLFRAFSFTNNEERNEFAKTMDKIPEEERNRIDFNYFSIENFDAVDAFYISYSKLKIKTMIQKHTEKKGYSDGEFHKDLYYVVS